MAEKSNGHNGWRVSVALATYNGERYLRQQIDSLLSQDYPIYEIIICDDLSSDGTLKVLDEFDSELITVYPNSTNLGYIKNFEKACGLCSGEIIALCDQDDIWESNKLSTLVDQIKKHELSGVFSDATLIDHNDKSIGGMLWEKTVSKALPAVVDRRSFYLANCVTGCTLLFRREILDVALPFPRELSHDWWLAFHAAAFEGLGSYPEALIKYRLHDANTIGVRSRSDKSRLLGLLNELYRTFTGGRLRRYNRDNELRRRQLALFKRAELDVGVKVSTELVELSRWVGAKCQRRSIDYPEILNDGENPVFGLYPLSSRFKENYRVAFFRIGAPVYAVRVLLLLLIMLPLLLCLRLE